MSASCAQKFSYPSSRKCIIYDVSVRIKSDNLQLNLVGQKIKLMLQLIVTHPVPFPQGHEEILPKRAEIFMQVSMLKKKSMRMSVSVQQPP